MERGRHGAHEEVNRKQTLKTERCNSRQRKIEKSGRRGREAEWYF